MAASTRNKFELWHSLVGGLALLILEALLMLVAPALGDWIIAAAAIFGSIAALVVATEVIEEVPSMRRMLEFLSIIMAEFVIFFALQYHFLARIDAASFPNLPGDPISLVLHSTMVFVFNPLWLPADGDGRALLLINTLAALGLVLFILQNIWQFRRK